MAELDRLANWEGQDLQIAATNALHKGALLGPTPITIPGGRLITTKALLPLLAGDAAARPIVFDVAGGPNRLPGALSAELAAQPGAFDDQIQQRFGQMLQQVTQGSRDVPLVFYCDGRQCWTAYNAALRAINLGYRDVLWYRGGIEAWQQAGLPLAQSYRGQNGAPVPTDSNPLLDAVSTGYGQLAPYAAPGSVLAPSSAVPSARTPTGRQPNPPSTRERIR